MLEKLISLYSYILHPTSEPWHLERWFFSCDCVCYTFHIFWASRNSLHCLLLSLCRRYCVSLNVAHFWFSPAKLYQVSKSLRILTTGQALMQKNSGTFTFLSSNQQWKAERPDRSTFSIDAHVRVCLNFLLNIGQVFLFALQCALSIIIFSDFLAKKWEIVQKEWSETVVLLRHLNL